MLSNSDIDYIVSLLKNAIKNSDWDDVEEALEYLVEYQEDPSSTADDDEEE